MGTDADRAALERVNRTLGHGTGTAEGKNGRAAQGAEGLHGL
jgi:hypothetical protein